MRYSRHISSILAWGNVVAATGITPNLKKVFLNFHVECVFGRNPQDTGSLTNYCYLLIEPFVLPHPLFTVHRQTNMKENEEITYFFKILFPNLDLGRGKNTYSKCTGKEI